MARRAPQRDAGTDDAVVVPPPASAAGLPALASAASEVLDKLGVVRGTRTALRVNQQEGFDCPGCAWPDPAHRHTFEFCENGIKAIAEEAMDRTAGPAFFARHSVAELGEASDYWLGQQGRLTHPMLLDEGAEHYRPVDWDTALDIIATELQELGSADEAVFYTSGRTSNEAAFAYQLFARMLGTNNLPDCSNMCHESSGVALTESIGIGKGSVLLDDFEKSDLIVVVGQNPGTNHPRMLTTMEKAKRNGTRILAINPLPEPGLIKFKNPQKASTYVGKGAPLADHYVRVRLGGDLALFQAIGTLLLELETSTGGIVDHEFIRDHTHGFEDYAAARASIAWPDIIDATGLTQGEIESVAGEFAKARSVIICWAMGVTQHRDAVATIEEFVNVLLLQGNIGRPGAGVCPVRGHSNVQGDRTMGIYEKMPDPWLDRLGAEFGFEPPRRHGFDTVDAIRAMRDGKVRVFMGMGGNWVRATPDSEVTEHALRNCRLTVQVSTKLNRSHAVTGARALILPTLGRSDRDLSGGTPQFVTVEDSMGVVHRSQGRLAPASSELRSEVDIVCAIAERTLGSAQADWHGMARDYARIRDHISRVVPDFEDFDTRVREPNGFTLPHGPRDSRTFRTSSGKAQFSVNDLEVLRLPPGRLILQTIRSHDQFNTTVYGMDDRYRGIHGGRYVVLVHPDDLAERGLRSGDRVTVISEWADGERRAEGFTAVEFDTARGCAAAYFPETNVLVPLDSVAKRSNTPTSKSIVIRLEPVVTER